MVEHKNMGNSRNIFNKMK